MRYLIAILALCTSSLALADTDVAFTQTPTGYVTDNPAYTVTQASVAPLDLYGNLKLTLSVNGVIYQGPLYSTLYASDGTSISAAVTYTTRRACTRSGRGQHCQNYYNVTDGTITLPY